MIDNANNFPAEEEASLPRKMSKAQQRRAEALINPASGLANDYLNLFNEIVMLIEQLPMMPELIDDILRWRPMSYHDYFAQSILPDRGSALDAYATLDPGFRRDFEALVADLDRRAVGAVAMIRKQYKAGNIATPTTAEFCARAGETLREVLLKATELVNYGTHVARESEQERADRLLYGNMRNVS